MKLNPYLNFNGQCAEAFKFYEKCLGGRSCRHDCDAVDLEVAE